MRYGLILTKRPRSRVRSMLLAAPSSEGSTRCGSPIREATALIRAAFVRDRLKQWEGLTDQSLLYSPSAGMSPERIEENVNAIIETVGQ